MARSGSRAHAWFRGLGERPPAEEEGLYQKGEEMLSPKNPQMSAHLPLTEYFSVRSCVKCLEETGPERVRNLSKGTQLGSGSASI